MQHRQIERLFSSMRLTSPSGHCSYESGPRRTQILQLINKMFTKVIVLWSHPWLKRMASVAYQFILRLSNQKNSLCSWRSWELNFPTVLLHSSWINYLFTSREIRSHGINSSTYCQYIMYHIVLSSIPLKLSSVVWKQYSIDGDSTVSLEKLDSILTEQ